MRILFLSTWFPYPPIHGAKSRAYNLLKALAARHEVALVSFEDMQLEKQWQEEIRKICVRVEIVKRDPFRNDPKKKILGWLSPLPRDVYASFSPEMERVTVQTAKEWKPEAVVALTFTMARYALKVRDAFRVVDADALMTGIMRDEFDREKGVKGRVRRLLAWLKFLRYEKWLYSQFDLCLSATENDRKKMAKLFGIDAGQIGVVPNGAFIQAQGPAGNVPQKNTLIYNGALTYQANFDAMEYFLKDIFPLICKEMPLVSMKITGSTNGVPIHLLPNHDNVIFTGFVDDIKALISSTWVCVVPLRIGGGTRIKILEAMALGTPVVSTSKGAEGLDVVDGVHLLIADTPEEFARKTIILLGDDNLRIKLSLHARRLVEERYSWQNIQDQFIDLVEANMRKRAETNVH